MIETSKRTFWWMSLAVVCLVAIIIASITTRDAGESKPSPPPPAVDELYLNASRLRDAGEYARAEQFLRQLLNAEPDHRDAKLLLAEALLGQGRIPEAYASLSEGLALRETADGHFFAGVVAARAGMVEASGHHYARADEMQPGNAKYIVYHGTAMLNLGRIDDAEHLAAKAMKIDPGLNESYVLLAKIAERGEDYARAIGFIDQALLRVAGQVAMELDYTLYKAQLLRASGQPGAGVNLLVSLPAEQRQRERIVEELAVSHHALGRPERAAKVWADRFMLNPTDARSAAKAGAYYIDADDAVQARRFLGLAQAIDSTQADVRKLAERLSNPRRISPELIP